MGAWAPPPRLLHLQTNELPLGSTQEICLPARGRLYTDMRICLHLGERSQLPILGFMGTGAPPPVETRYDHKYRRSEGGRLQNRCLSVG